MARSITGLRHGRELTLAIGTPMPVSTPVHLSHCLNHIIQLSPQSILDVGCGFGMWGFLCRTYLDAFCERVYKKDWRVRIDGIEYFEPYILEHQRAR